MLFISISSLFSHLLVPKAKEAAYSLRERRIQPAFCILPDEAIALSLANLTKVSLLGKKVGWFSANYLDMIHNFSIFIEKPKLQNNYTYLKLESKYLGASDSLRDLQRRLALYRCHFAFSIYPHSEAVSFTYCCSLRSALMVPHETCHIIPSSQKKRVWQRNVVCHLSQGENL